MTLLFSKYLEDNKVKKEELSNFSKRYIYIYAWIEKLTSVIGESSIYCPEAYKQLSKFFTAYIEEHYIKKPWKNITKTLMVLDQAGTFFYKKIIDFAIRRSKEKPISPILEYSYNSSYSGVSMCAYIVRKENGVSSIYENKCWEASDYLNNEKEGVSLKQIKNNILNAVNTSNDLDLLRQLSEKAKELIRKRVIGHFHAEDYWFSVQLIQLIAFIETNRDKFRIAKSENKEIWIQKLNAETRIEFVMTSSPCVDCQSLFIEMQKILVRLNLEIPIVIFSNSPTNNSEVEYSQIAIINSDNEYFNTGLVASMPYTLQRKKICSQLLIAQEVYFGNKEMFNRLELAINQVMLEMILSPSSLRNSFIGSLFTNLEDGYVDMGSLCWFLNFLKRLPEGFYDEDYIDEDCSDEDDDTSEITTFSMSESEIESLLRTMPNTETLRMGTVPIKQTKIESFLEKYSKQPDLFFNKDDFMNPKSECRHKNLIFASLDETLEPYVLFSRDEDAIFDELFEREDIKNYSISFSAVNRLRFFHAIKSDKYEERPSNTRPHSFDSYYYYSWRLKNGI